MINKRTLLNEYGFKPFGNTKSKELSPNYGKIGEFFRGEIFVSFQSKEKLIVRKIQKGPNGENFGLIEPIISFKTNQDIEFERFLNVYAIFKKLKKEL